MESSPEHGPESETEQVEEREGWSEQDCLRLIGLYQQYSILWDPKHANYYKKHAKSEAWAEVAGLLPNHTSEERCRNKMVSLLSSYRREKAKEAKSRGKGASQIYKSRWFAYSSLKFLEDRDRPRKIKKRSHGSNESAGATTTFTSTTLPSTPQAAAAAAAATELNEAVKQITPDLKKVKTNETTMLGDVLGILKTTTNKLQESQSSDEIHSFCNFLANKMNNYSDHTKTAVQHAFFEIIMKADNGEYEYNNPSSCQYNTNEAYNTSMYDQKTTATSGLR